MMDCFTQCNKVAIGNNENFRKVNFFYCFNALKGALLAGEISGDKERMGLGASIQIMF